MSWRQLKNFALAVLLCMNLLFFLLILQRNQLSTHYDNDLIDSALEILHQSEIYVDRSLLEGRVASLPVYSGDVGEGKSLQMDIVSAVGKAGFTVTEEPGGYRCKNAIGEFYFSNDFGFYYSEKGRYDRPSDLLKSERYILIRENTEERLSVLRVVGSFLEKYAFLSTQDARYGYEVAYSAVYSSGVNYIVTLSQSVDGIPIHEEITVMVSGGRVVGADGVFVTAVPARRETAESVDLLNILFMEKAYVDELYREGGSFSYTPRVVGEIAYSYAVYFDDRDNFYLIPLCAVRYAGAETRIYNCVSGKLYS